MSDLVSDVGLEVDHLMVRYGGNVAVNDVTLAAPVGRMTGLLGPNGAGKTTIFNACSGLLRPSGGAIRLFGEDVSHLAAAARARRGLGRTFQRMALFDSMSVGANIALGREAGIAGTSPLRQVFSTRAQRSAVDDAVDAALDACGLRPLADRRVGALSTGQRRLVELARALAGDYRLLLLDEPSSGLDQAETEEFGEIIRDVVDSRGIGILLVEHDMSLVMNVCDHLFVLDFGELLFEGTPAETQHNAVVRAAYLGTSV